jgi:hypothetical protein
MQDGFAIFDEGKAAVDRLDLVQEGRIRFGGVLKMQHPFDCRKILVDDAFGLDRQSCRRIGIGDRPDGLVTVGHGGLLGHFPILQERG